MLRTEVLLNDGNWCIICVSAVAFCIWNHINRAIFDSPLLPNSNILMHRHFWTIGNWYLIHIVLSIQRRSTSTYVSEPNKDTHQYRTWWLVKPKHDESPDQHHPWKTVPIFILDVIIQPFRFWMHVVRGIDLDTGIHDRDNLASDNRQVLLHCNWSWKIYWIPCEYRFPWLCSIFGHQISDGILCWSKPAFTLLRSRSFL